MREMDDHDIDDLRDRVAALERELAETRAELGVVIRGLGESFEALRSIADALATKRP
jgi:hypothetical protein